VKKPTHEKWLLKEQWMQNVRKFHENIAARENIPEI
jgi:hypothetical protein